MTKIWFAAAAVGVGLSLTLGGAGCTGGATPPELASAAHAMDAIAKDMEEFGNASISAPVLASPDEAFKFELKKVDPDQFFQDAKTGVSARVANFDQAVNIAGLAARASVDPTMAAAYAAQLAQYQQAMTRNALAQNMIDQKNGLINAAAVEAYNRALTDARGQTDPAKQQKAIDDAIKNLNAQMVAPAPAAPPDFPAATQPAAAPLDLAKNASDAAAVFADGKFAAFQGLLAGRTAPTLSNREALYIAAGDNATAAIFKTLGDPGLASKFADKKVVLGVVTVAVNPGWRTRQNYAADISVVTRYEYQPARLEVVKNFVNDENVDAALRGRVAVSYGLTLPTGNGPLFDRDRPVPEEYSLLDIHRKQPLVAAVSPLTQTQVREEQNSRRQQRQFALDLAAAFGAAGLTAQANFFDHFARSLQQDVDTVNPTNLVNTYSHNGGLFGFEVGPRLQAVVDPTRRRSDPGLVLERQSFPALVIFGFEADELRPRVKRDRYGRFRLFEPVMQLATVTNWLPLTENPGDGERRSEERRVRLMSQLGKDAWTTMMSAPQTPRGDFAAAVDLVRQVADSGKDQWSVDREDLRNLAAVLSEQAGLAPKRAPLLNTLRRSAEELEPLVGLPAQLKATAALYNSEADDVAKKAAKPTATSEDKEVAEARATHLRDVAKGLEKEAEAIAKRRQEFDRFKHDAEAVCRGTEVVKGAVPGGPLGEPFAPRGSGIAETVFNRVYALEYRAFDATFEAPLPVNYVAAGEAPKPAKVTDVLSDFVPTPEVLYPSGAVKFTVLGSNLKGVDVKKIALVPDDLKSVALSDAKVTDGILTFTAKGVPLNRAFAFVLPPKSGEGPSVITPPVLFPRLDWWNSKRPTIQRTTGPANDPTQQRIDRIEFEGVPDAVVRSEIEKHKPQPASRPSVDVNVVETQIRTPAASGGLSSNGRSSNDPGPGAQAQDGRGSK